MELRRLGKVVLHSRISPLASALLPSVTNYSPRVWHTTPSIASRQQQPMLLPPCSRSTSTSKQSAVASPPKPGSTPKTDDEDLESLLNLPPRHRSQTSGSALDPTSASDIISHYRTYDTSRASRVPTERMIPPSPSTATSNTSTPSTSFLNASTPLLDTSPARPPTQPTIRLNASTGRTVLVEPRRGMDLARTFKVLDIMCRQNNIKQDFMRQRFHERPGLKRKRLKSVRWRRKFMVGFKEMVGKVDDMRRKGW